MEGPQEIKSALGGNKQQGGKDHKQGPTANNSKGDTSVSKHQVDNTQHNLAINTSETTSGPAPDTIKNRVDVNASAEPYVSVSNPTSNETVVTVSVPVSSQYGDKLAATDAPAIVNEVNSYGSKTVVENGHIYKLDMKLKYIGPEVHTITENNILGPPRGALVITSYAPSKISSQEGGNADVGGPIVHLRMNEALRHSYIPTHEILHGLGLWHQKNSTGGVMSYAAPHKINAWVIKQLIKGYSK